ncbi:hypothetical protein [Janthinobacterium sp.]|uniref:hypothetical protein n=1 Tax=Janthinobacterium sp. TaxID=1871054 RepID=UPI00262E66A9|nr:hypothetical protein [Janthinobacterium sp.]
MDSASLTQRLLNRHRHDAEDALQQVALAVLQQEGIRDDSVLRAARIAALAPPVACVVTLAEWLAYVDWEGFDSALYANIGAVAGLIADDLLLPEVAVNLLQTRDAAVFEAQRPALAQALISLIERHIALFPI